MWGGSARPGRARPHNSHRDLTLSERIPPAFVAAAAAASASAAAADEATSSANKRGASSAASSYVWSLFGGRKGVKQDAPIQDGDDEGIYAQFLFDFRYLRDPEECERSIGSATAAPRRLEADFVTKYGDIVARFYRLFECIYLYQVDLNKFAEDLASGRYVQHTLESVLSDREGRQLAAEALHLYATMLILTQMKFGGGIRERMIVAYLRYRSQGGLDPRMRNVAKLFSSIGVANKLSHGGGSLSASRCIPILCSSFNSTGEAGVSPLHYPLLST